MRLGYLTPADRLRILRTLGRLVKLPSDGESDDSATIGAWLTRQGESDRALGRFWSVVLVSALGETLDRASLAAARKVFVDGFLASRRAYELEVPRVALAEILDRRVGDWLRARGVTVHRRLRVKEIDGDADRARAVVLPDGSLTGEGVKQRIRQKLLEECNLHTIVRAGDVAIASGAGARGAD